MPGRMLNGEDRIPRLAQGFLSTLVIALVVGLLAAPSAGAAAQSADKQQCRDAYQYLVRKDGSFFHSAGQCVGYQQSSHQAYWPSTNVTEVIFYGRPNYPNLVTDLSGDVVGGISLSINGQATFPPDIPI